MVGPADVEELGQQETLQARPSTQPRGVDDRRLLLFAGLTVLSVIVIVLLFVAPWMQVNAARQFSDAFGVTVADEWRDVDRQDLWDALKDIGWAQQSRVVYPIAGTILVGIVGLVGSAMALVPLSPRHRARSDVVLALLAGTGAAIAATGALRSLAPMLALLLNGGGGMRVTWLLWMVALLGVAGAAAAGWFTLDPGARAAQRSARAPLRMAVACVAAALALALIPVVVVETAVSSDGSTLFVDHASYVASQGDHRTPGDLLGVTGFLLWTVAAVAAALAVFGLFARPDAAGRHAVAVVGLGLACLLTVTGLVVAVVAAVWLVAMPDALPFVGFLATLVHGVVAFWALLALRAGWRAARAEGPITTAPAA